MQVCMAAGESRADGGRRGGLRTLAVGGRGLAVRPWPGCCCVRPPCRLQSIIIGTIIHSWLQACMAACILVLLLSSHGPPPLPVLAVLAAPACLLAGWVLLVHPPPAGQGAQGRGCGTARAAAAGVATASGTRLPSGGLSSGSGPGAKGRELQQHQHQHERARERGGGQRWGRSGPAEKGREPVVELAGWHCGVRLGPPPAAAGLWLWRCGHGDINHHLFHSYSLTSAGGKRSDPLLGAIFVFKCSSSASCIRHGHAARGPAPPPPRHDHACRCK